MNSIASNRLVDLELPLTAGASAADYRCCQAADSSHSNRDATMFVAN